MVGLAPKWIRLAPNGTNPGLFNIRFQWINALKSDLKKPGICPIRGQSDPLWSQTYHPRCVSSAPLCSPLSHHYPSPHHHQRLIDLQTVVKAWRQKLMSVQICSRWQTNIEDIITFPGQFLITVLYHGNYLLFLQKEDKNYINLDLYSRGLHYYQVMTTYGKINDILKQNIPEQGFHWDIAAVYKDVSINIMMYVYR